MKPSTTCAAALVALALAACGQKGPLYMPDTTQGQVVTRPAPAATGSNSPGTPDSPQQSPSPAPEVTAPVTTAPEDQDAKPPGKNKQSGTAAPPPK